MADRDVKFIIKAKDEASREIKSIAEAMEVLGKNTSEAADDAAATKGMFGRLGDELKKLSSQKAAFDALGRVATHMQKAGTAANALKGEVAGLRTSLATQSDAAKKAGDNTDRLRAQLAALNDTYKKQKGELEANRRGLGREAEATKTLTDAKRDLRRANALSTKNPERETRIVNAQQAVKDAQAAVDANVAANQQLATAAKKTREEIKLLDQQVSASEKNFRKITSEVDNLKAAIDKSEGQIAKADEALASIAQTSAAAAERLGVVVGEEAELAAQTKKLVPEIEKVAKALAAMEKFSNGRGLFVDPKTASALQKQRGEIERAEEAWKSLEGMVKDLAKEMRAAGGSTDAQTAQFNELIAASKAAKANFDAQVVSLGRLQGATAGTFAEFAKAHAPLDKVQRQIEANRQKTDELTAAMDRYRIGSGAFADSKSAAAIQKQTAVIDEARSRWQLLSAESTRLATAMRQGGAGAADLAPQFRAVTAAANAAEREFREAEQALRQLVSAGRQDVFGRFNSDARTTLSLYQRLRGEVLALAASYVGFYGAIQNVSGVLDAYQKMEAAQNRLGVVFKQNESLTRSELTWLERQAQRLGIEFGSLADQYGKFAVSAQAANFSQAETRKLFLSVAEAGRVNKLSLEDMNGVFLALTQMIQKGRVSSEELRQQLGERLPGAVNIFADALGVTTAELSKMLEEGEVAADSTNLLKFADELNERFGSQLPRALQSTTTLLGQFFDNLFQARLRFADGGFIDSFNRALEDMNQWFRSREGRDFFLSLGAAAGKAVDVLALIPQNINLIMGVVKALVATKLAMWFLDMVSGARQGTTAAQLWVASNVKMVSSNSALIGSLATLKASVATFVGSLTLNNAKMVAAGAATNTWAAITNASVARVNAARAGAVAFSGALTGLRAAMNAAAIAGRALWTAIGGLPGLIASAVAFIGAELLSDWISGVDEATTALDRHKELMGKVIESYEKVKDSTDKWRDALKDLPLDVLEKNADDLKQKMADTTEQLLALGATPFPRALGGWSDTFEQVEKLRQAFKRQEIDAKTLRSELDKIYGRETNQSAKEYLRTVLDLARKLEDFEHSVGQADDAVRKKRRGIEDLNRSANDIKSPLDELVNAADDSTEAFTEGAEAATAYAEALDGIKEMIPRLKAEMEKLKDINKLNEQMRTLASQGLDAITPEAVKFYNEARREIEVKFNEESQRLLKEAFDTKTEEAGRSGILATAQKFSGANENQPEGRSLLRDFFAAANNNIDPAMVPWCAAFVNAVLAANGIKGTGSNAARSFLSFGEDTDNPKPGDIVVLRRGNNQTQGHVGFFQGFDQQGNVRVLGGNQATRGNTGAVNEKTFNAEDVLGFRKVPSLASQELEDQQKLNELEKERTEERKKQQESTNERISDNQFELEQETLKLAGKEKQAAIEAAIREAKKENPEIGATELEQIKQQAAALWEKQNALTAEEQKKKEISALDERINALETQRNALLEQRRFYEEAGNRQGIEDTDAALAGVNSQLQQAIDKSIAFHQALGGEKAAATVAQLNSMKLAIAQSNMEGQRFAMTAGEMSNSIFQSLEGGIIGGFHALASAIANGENAVDSLKTAFRQWAADFLIMMAEMIIKQTLFNALQGFSKSLGGGLFNFLSFHSGGVVGEGGAGTRAISPLWFNNAVRYHIGGIAGLAPGEVPAVLKEGEEILTEDNPRHIKNGGGSTSSPSIKIVNTFDPASYLTEALNSAVGEEAILNYVRNNPGAFKQALEG